MAADRLRFFTRMSEAVLHAFLLLLQANLIGKCVRSIGNGSFGKGEFEQFKAIVAAGMVAVSAPLFFSKNHRTAPTMIAVCTTLLITGMHFAFVREGIASQGDSSAPVALLVCICIGYSLGLGLLFRTSIGRALNPFGEILLAFLTLTVTAVVTVPYLPSSILVDEIDLVGTYGVYVCCVLQGLLCMISSSTNSSKQN